MRDAARTGMVVAWVTTLVVASSPVAGAAEEDEFAERFAGPIEAAHGNAAWGDHEAVRFDFALKSPEGKTRLAADILFETGPERVRMDVADGTVAVWDGQDAWVEPADTGFAEGKPRFHLRTWTYFLAAPFKLRDPGTFLRAVADGPLREGKSPDVDRAKLTFGEGVGDAPDDWYVVYREPKTARLKGLAYIVTYGPTDPEEAAKAPHVVIYSDFEEVAGVTLPMTWTFYNWSAEQGAHGEALFVAEVRNLRFVQPAEGVFASPEGAKRVPLPGE